MPRFPLSRSGNGGGFQQEKPASGGVSAGVSTFNTRSGAVSLTGADVSGAGAEMVVNKGVANGYAALDSGLLVPRAQLGTGAADSTKFLRGDGTWQVPPGGGGAVTSVFTRTGAVVAVSGDYTAAQVTNAADKAAAGQQLFTGEVKAPDVAVSGLTGAVNPTRFAGATASGAPVAGTFATGDFIIDLTGKVWVCTAGGTSGTWANAGSSSGVSSFNARTGAVVPVSGDYTAAQVTNAADKSSASPQIFVAEVKALDLAVAGLTGAVQASRHVGATTSGAPLTGTFAIGDFVLDQTGKFWICTVAGSPGTWTAAGGAGGTYTPPWSTIESPGAAHLAPSSAVDQYIFVPPNKTQTAVNTLLGLGTASTALGAFWFDPADWAVSGLVSKVRVRGWVITDGTTSLSGSLVFGFYPVTAFSNTSVITLGGSVISGTISTPALSTQTHVESGIVNAPAAGWYVLAVTLTTFGTPPAVTTTVGMRLQLKQQ